MNYYNRSLEKLNLNRKKLKYIGHGQCAKVFRYDDIVFKEYYYSTHHMFRINTDMFDILKDINNAHFVELIDIYTRMDIIEKYEFAKRIIPFTVDAYTAKYYESQLISIIYESSDYLLDNFKELEQLFKIFTDNLIGVDDIKMENIVASKNGIVIIDPDLFYTQPSMDPTFISIQNKKKLLTLLRSIYLNSSIGDHHRKIASKIDKHLINIEVDENTDITYEISKKLKYTKKPIDFFLK